MSDHGRIIPLSHEPYEDERLGSRVAGQLDQAEHGRKAAASRRTPKKSKRKAPA